MPPGVTIHPQIPARCRGDAARLYWQAFGGKLGRIYGPDASAVDFITRAMQLDHGICALNANGALLGVAGFRTAQGALVDGTFSHLRAVYGTPGALVRLALMAALTSEVENERFLIDGIFVSPQARCQGIGTALLGGIADVARARGYTALRLDVIDTNPRAHALYRAQGFTDLHTRKTGFLRPVFGFAAATAMVRDI